MKTNFKVLGACVLLINGGMCSVAIAKKPSYEPIEPVIKWSMAKRTERIKNLEFMPELANGNRHWMIKGPNGQPGLYGGVSSVPLDQINPKKGFEVELYLQPLTTTKRLGS